MNNSFHHYVDYESDVSDSSFDMSNSSFDMSDSSLDSSFESSECDSACSTKAQTGYDFDTDSMSDEEYIKWFNDAQNVLIKYKLNDPIGMNDNEYINFNDAVTSLLVNDILSFEEERRLIELCIFRKKSKNLD